jgi:EAL domain-containing protein (putative c-di-GMP-specific phosphodiesterase class I)
VLKIDRSFVRDLSESTHARDLVASIIQLAHALGLEPLAEGVEAEDQRRFLVEHNCRYGQGFLFSRPVPAHEIKRVRDAHPRRGRDLA